MLHGVDVSDLSLINDCYDVS